MPATLLFSDFNIMATALDGVWSPFSSVGGGIYVMTMVSYLFGLLGSRTATIGIEPSTVAKAIYDYRATPRVTFIIFVEVAG
jgi:hypothetical protein